MCLTYAERMHNVCVNCAVNYMKNVLSNIIKVLKVMMDGEIIMYNETLIVAGPVCQKNYLFPVNSDQTRMKNKRYILRSLTKPKTFNLRIRRKFCVWVSTCFCTILCPFLFRVWHYTCINFVFIMIWYFGELFNESGDRYWLSTQSATSIYKRTQPRAMANTLSKVMDKCIVYSLNRATTWNKFSFRQTNDEYVNTHLLVIFHFFW